MIGNGGVPLDLGTTDCNATQVSDAAAVARLVSGASESGTVAIVGVGCASTVAAASPALAAAYMPTISYTVNDANFANATAYPFFLRTSLSETLLGNSMANFILSLDWTRVGVLHQVRHHCS